MLWCDGDGTAAAREANTGSMCHAREVLVLTMVKDSALDLALIERESAAGDLGIERVDLDFLLIGEEDRRSC